MAKTRQEHSDEMFRTHATADMTRAQHDKIYSKAYEDGHAYGYEEVESYYSDLVDLIIDYNKAK